MTDRAFTALLPDRRPIVISGPSGVGKGTLAQMLLDKHPGVFTETVSHTTRGPRKDEVEGQAYYFVSPSTFNDLLSRGGFVEHTYFSGNSYGTSEQTITERMAKGLVVILDIDTRGVEQMKAGSRIDARYVFIKPPNFDTLEKRLRSRGTESEGQIEKRLQQAREELKYADTPGVFDKIIVNAQLQEAYDTLEAFIYQSLV